MKPGFALWGAIVCAVAFAFGTECRAATVYVSLDSPNPTSPFTNWLTAATNIQDAVDAANPGDLVLVSNGVYQAGGRVVPPFALTNRVIVSQPVTLQSLNGPASTSILGNPVIGDSAVRCVYLTSGAALYGFTLANGATRTGNTDVFNERSGGGVNCASSSVVLSNCVISNCAAAYYGGAILSGSAWNCLIVSNTAYYGGGAGNANLTACWVAGNTVGDPVHLAGGGGGINCRCTNCVFTGNFAYGDGGALYSSGQIINCTIVGNGAGLQGGGIYAATATNSIIYFNNAPDFTSNYSATLNFCCTMPPFSKYPPGNPTNDPLFVDWAHGDLHLQSNSLCINSGTNSVATAHADFDGNTRIVGRLVDIGAYEFQTPGSILPLAWLSQYNLPLDGSADFADTDADGMNNYQEWRAGTIPTNAASNLAFTSITNGFGRHPMLTWNRVFGVRYILQRSTNLPVFQTLTNAEPQGSTYIDTSATNPVPYFYRIIVP